MHEQALHRQEQNQTHMTSMRISETFQQTLYRQQQDRVHKASVRATERIVDHLNMISIKLAPRVLHFSAVHFACADLV